MKLFWEKVGAVPLNLNCLLIPLSQHTIAMEDGDIGITNEPQETDLATILINNKESCDKLCNMGYKGNIFIMKLKTKEASSQPWRITHDNSSKCREALIESQTDGVHFKVTGGYHFTSDDMLIGYELVEKKKKITKLESQKKDALVAIQRK